LKVRLEQGFKDNAKMGLEKEAGTAQSLRAWCGALRFAAPLQQKTSHRTTMTKYVPMISSGLAGPLGILHLPRLWQKASLEAQGKLHADYPGIGKGYDSMVLAALHLDEAAVRAFIKTKPSYPQFETWIKQQPGVKLDKATVYKSNAAILGYIHGDDTRRDILEGNGLADDGSVNPGAVDLNNLDDWGTFHKDVLS